MTNRTRDQQIDLVSHFLVKTASGYVDFSQVSDTSIVGNCAGAGTTDVNEAFQMPPGQTRRIGARIQFDANDTSLHVGCKEFDGDVGLPDGRMTKAFWSREGTIPPTYSGPFSISIQGTTDSTGTTGGNLSFESVATADSVAAP